VAEGKLSLADAIGRSADESLRNERETAVTPEGNAWSVWGTSTSVNPRPLVDMGLGGEDFVHNHPYQSTNAIVGRGFSPADIASAGQRGARSMTAVEPDGTVYTARPGARGWPSKDRVETTFGPMPAPTKDEWLMANEGRAAFGVRLDAFSTVVLNALDTKIGELQGDIRQMEDQPWNNYDTDATRLELAAAREAYGRIAVWVRGVGLDG
jgi:hypothetical protein